MSLCLGHLPALRALPQILGRLSPSGSIRSWSNSFGGDWGIEAGTTEEAAAAASS